MSISEQVKELRKLAKNFSELEYNRFYNIISRAADAIESLSAKQENMERSAGDCGSGWIYCGDGKNLPEVECDVLLSTRRLDVYKGYRANREEYFYAEGEGYILYEDILAWQPLPEPYHEP